MARSADHPLRIGVVGAGVMGADHARTIARSGAGAVVTAVADVDREWAVRLADEVGGSASDDGVALIGADDVDAVLVASHDSTHAGLVLAAIAAGKPVLCEKPLTLDLGEAAAIVDAESAAGRRLVSVGFSRRFDPALTRLRERLQDGAIGRPLVAHAVHRNVSTYPGGDSAATVFNSAVHELDQVPWLLSSPLVEVGWHAGASTSLLPDRQDPQVLLLRTADGVLTVVEVFVNAVYGYEVRIEVSGETGVLSTANAALVVQDSDLQRRSAHPEDWRPRFADAYRLEVQAWIAAASSGDYAGSGLATAEDGRRATAAAHALVQSMRTGGAFVPVSAHLDPPRA